MSLFRNKPDEYFHVRFGPCHGPSPKAMPKMFDELANYNSRVEKGIVHTAEFVLRMAKLQAQFNEWRDETWRP